MTNTKSKRYIVLALLIVLVAVIAVPLPYKPSIWSYAHRKRLDQNLATYSAPLYIPSQSEVSSVGFETYLGWKNSYAIRGFADKKLHTGGYLYYQLAKDGIYSESSEGPSQYDMRPFNEALAMNCESHASGIHICQVGSPKFYIAKLDVGEAVLLSDITRKVFNKDKLDVKVYPMPYDYLPPTEDDILTISEILQKAQPMPIAKAKKYFKPEF